MCLAGILLRNCVFKNAQNLGFKTEGRSFFFLEMSILYTTNVFSTHFIENTHFRNNLSKQSVPLCFFSIYFGSLSFTIYLYFVVCLCKLSKYCNYVQNFRELTNVLFIFYSSPLFFHNSIKVCYKE